MSNKKQITINLEEEKLSINSFTQDQIVTIGFLELAKELLLRELLENKVPVEIKSSKQKIIIPLLPSKDIN